MGGRSRGRANQSISAIRVTGFKSMRNEVDVAIRSLTVIAGQNSSGKSTLLQPLLLMKQTLEAPHDPDPLLLYGECIKVHDASTLFWHGRAKHDHSVAWSVGIQVGGHWIDTTFDRHDGRFQLASTTFDTHDGTRFTLDRRVDPTDLKRVFPNSKPFEQLLSDATFRVEQRRCGFVATVKTRDAGISFGGVDPLPREELLDVIHLPGLRGAPERVYPVTRVADRFPGTFPPYTASVVLGWKETKDERVARVGEDLALLGLSWKVDARQIDDARVGLWVGRLRRAQQGGALDLVNIADVGVGVSQVLPIVVALREARFGQVVHVEQPEIHLHPNAQVGMADLLVDAAKRGVRVIVETHSSVLLKALLVAVAKGALPASEVNLAWFRRDDDGITSVRQTAPGVDGTFGEWPVDFADVELRIEQEYIDAVTEHALRPSDKRV